MGETISAEEGERREEEDGGSGYRYFYNMAKDHDRKLIQLSVDAAAESGFLGRLVNHGEKRERNAVMKEVNGVLCLFSLRHIKPGEEILYDYGLKNYPWESKKHSKKRKADYDHENGIPVCAHDEASSLYPAVKRVTRSRSVASPCTLNRGKNDIGTEIGVYENHEITDNQNAMGDAVEVTDGNSNL